MMISVASTKSTTALSWHKRQQDDSIENIGWKYLQAGASPFLN